MSPWHRLPAQLSTSLTPSHADSVATAAFDAIKQTMVLSFVSRRPQAPQVAHSAPMDHGTQGSAKPAKRGEENSHVGRDRSVLSFTSFRHGGFTEGAESDLTDAELRAAGRHRSARQLPTLADTEAADIRDQETARGANKSSRFVGIAAERSSETAHGIGC